MPILHPPSPILTIQLENIGRRFNRDWIFRNLNYSFHSGNSYAILGSNGSGKSTLLQVISGSLTPSEGSILYSRADSIIEMDAAYQFLVLAAPYQELIEEFSLREHIRFHFKFKNYFAGLNEDKLIDLLGLRNSEDKAIKNFSSGMKQRTKLAMAFCSDTPVLLLDEPCTNLDQEGINWYRNLISTFTASRLVIICSNQEHEYSFCQNQLLISDYKS